MVRAIWIKINQNLLFEIPKIWADSSNFSKTVFGLAHAKSFKSTFHQNYLTSQLIGFMMEFHRQVNKEKNIYEFLQESFVEFEPKKAIFSYMFKFPRSEQAEIQLNSLFYWIILKSDSRNKPIFFEPLPGSFQKCQKVF